MNYLLIILFLINFNLFGMEDSDSESTTASMASMASIPLKKNNFFSGFFSSLFGIKTETEFKKEKKKMMELREMEVMLLRERYTKDIKQHEQEFYHIIKPAAIKLLDAHFIEINDEQNRLMNRIKNDEAVRSEEINTFKKNKDKFREEVNKERESIEEEENKNQVIIREKMKNLIEKREVQWREQQEMQRCITQQLDILGSDKNINDREKFMKEIKEKTLQLEEENMKIQQDYKEQQDVINKEKQEFMSDIDKKFNILNFKIAENLISEEEQRKNLKSSFVSLEKRKDDLANGYNTEIYFHNSFKLRLFGNMQNHEARITKARGFDQIKNVDELDRIKIEFHRKGYAEIEAEKDFLSAGEIPYAHWEWIRQGNYEPRYSIYGLRWEDRKVWYFIEYEKNIVCHEWGNCNGNVFLEALKKCKALRPIYGISFKDALISYHQEWAQGQKELSREYIDELENFLINPIPTNDRIFYMFF
jgi:hypothetical protein